MEIIDEDKTLISKFNLSDDYDILRMLVGEALSVEEKRYLIEHCQNRIEQMAIDIFLQMIRQTDRDFCEECNQYLSSKIPSLTVAQTEKLLYVNEYYHKVSEIAKFLVKQDWFQKKKTKEYKTFFMAYELEKMLKEESIDKKKIIDFGIDIANQLTLTDGEPRLFDMVIKNYLSLVEKYNPEWFEEFKRQGYAKMNQQIASNQELTHNMIIFDCNITKIELGTNVDNFEFFEDENGESFANAHAGTVRINVAAIKINYQQYENKKIGTQMLLYVLGHEIDHVFCERYQLLEKRANNNSMTELKVFNAGVGAALQEILVRSFYLEYHNCFSHEFVANIQGIRTLYQKQKYLPSITKEDKENINQLLAQILLYSYCLVGNNSTEYGYVGPVEFTRGKFNNFKDNLPGRVIPHLLNGQKDLPSELEIFEQNLSEEEKFILGYYNQYIGILELIADEKVKSTNLFEDLPILYDKYQSLVEGKYSPYLTSDNNIRKEK